MDILNEASNTYICEECDGIVDLEASACWELMQTVSQQDIPCLCATCLMSVLIDKFEQAAQGLGKDPNKLMELYYKSELCKVIQLNKSGLN